MAITAVFFLAIYFGGLALAFLKHPKYGLYTYLFAFYMHPPDRWWRDDVPDIRWSFYAGLLTLVLTVWKLGRDPVRPPWLKTTAGRFFILYLLWMAFQTQWAITGDFHREGLELIAKYAILCYLIYRLVDSEREMLMFFLAHVLGSFYLGWLAYGKDVRGRLEGMGGPGIDDANTFAMHLSTAAVFGAALLMRGPNSLRVLMVVTMPFVLNAVILTQSRGAFIGLVAAALLIVLLRPRRKRLLFYSLAGLGATLFLSLAPPEFLNRMESITVAVEVEEERDRSAETRIMLAQAQLEMWKDHPFGTGHRGTRVLSPQYLDEEYLTVDDRGEGRVRSSHNTLLAVLVDQGIPGIVLYGWLLFVCFGALWSMKRLDRHAAALVKNYSLSTYRMALGGALAATLVAGMFSNYFKAEVFVWIVALTAALKPLVDKAIKDESLVPAPVFAAVPDAPAELGQAQGPAGPQVGLDGNLAQTRVKP